MNISTHLKFDVEIATRLGIRMALLIELIHNTDGERIPFLSTTELMSKCPFLTRHQIRGDLKRLRGCGAITAVLCKRRGRIIGLVYRPSGKRWTK